MVTPIANGNGEAQYIIAIAVLHQDHEAAATSCFRVYCMQILSWPNSCANAMNSNAKAMNSIAKPTNSIENGTNSTAKVTNSTVNS